LGKADSCSEALWHWYPACQISSVSDVWGLVLNPDSCSPSGPGTAALPGLHDRKTVFHMVLKGCLFVVIAVIFFWVACSFLSAEELLQLPQTLSLEGTQHLLKLEGKVLGLSLGSFCCSFNKQQLKDNATPGFSLTLLSN